MENARSKLGNKGLIAAIFGPIVLLAIVWIMYFTKILFDLDLVQLLKRKENAISKTEALNFALAVTVICLPWAWFSYRKFSRLAKNGVTVPAELVSTGLVYQGQIVCTFKYEYNGKDYTRHLDLLHNEAAKIGIGGKYLFLVDPDNPSRSQPRSDIFPGE
jgi:hypothetical protein